MFVELLPLLGERTVMITVSRFNQNSIRVNFTPSRKKEDENPALATPLSFSGTPEELDRELGSGLASYVEENLRLQSALTEAKAEMEAAGKAARDQARAKAGQTAKNQEDAAAKEAAPANTAPAEAEHDLVWCATEIINDGRGNSGLLLGSKVRCALLGRKRPAGMASRQGRD